ncbi:hypothetical protein ASZ90_019975 [hydrocarbon metagenome]|uniref:Uncharacterized protein n=1 Tax=hydrocarbon metagenome TaxID=938273 RepID=A0A0W8E1Q7_9ZZZZ
MEAVTEPSENKEIVNLAAGFDHHECAPRQKRFIYGKIR